MSAVQSINYHVPQFYFLTFTPIQDKAMWVGILAVIMSSVSPVIAGRLNDLLQGHIKALLITLMLATTAFCYWFLLLSYGILEVNDCKCVDFFLCGTHSVRTQLPTAT